MSSTISVRIPGEFDDAYLYKGILYLWRINHSIQIIDWEKLISYFQEAQPDDKLILDWSFRNNSFLQSREFESILSEPLLRPGFGALFNRVDKSRLTLDDEVLQKFTIRQRDSHIDNLADLAFYSDEIYASTTSGIYATSTKSLIGDSNGTRKMSDVYAVSLSARYSTLNSSCCEEGLLCFSTFPKDNESKPLYHWKEFTRATSWIGSDFLTLGRDSFSYFTNRTKPEKESAELISNVSDYPTRERRSREASVTGFGEKILEGDNLVSDEDRDLKIGALFTVKNSLYVCGHVQQQWRVVRWRKTMRQFQEQLTERRTLDGVSTEVFRGYAIGKNIAALDTAQGTLIVSEEEQAKSLTNDVNVVLRAFPESRWYQSLVCSVQEDHALISCIWPLQSPNIEGIINGPLG